MTLHCIGIMANGVVNESVFKEEVFNNNQAAKKSSCLEEIERLKNKREERRKKMDNQRKQKLERELMNEAQGIKVDVDF